MSAEGALRRSVPKLSILGWRERRGLGGHTSAEQVTLLFQI